MFGIKNVKSQKMLIVTVISSVVLILVGIGIYLWLKSKNKKSSITPVPTTPPITTPPITTQPQITTSIFKDTKPPFGIYYISDGSNNSIITVDDTKVVFESKFNNVYTKKELTNPVSAKNGGYDGTYYFKDIDIKSYKLFITILYIPSMQAYKEPFVMISYYNPSNNALVKSFNSAKGVNNKPSSFIQPSP